MFIIGGLEDKRSVTDSDKCHVFYILTLEVEQIAKLDRTRREHSLHHASGSNKAYIVGGYDILSQFINKCLVFDIKNLKFQVLGSIVTARYLT